MAKYKIGLQKINWITVEADNFEEARELVINDCGILRIADEVEDIEVRKLV